METLKKISGHTEVLTKEARGVISKLASLVSSQFYLAGGTALALQIGHRISIDFDFFTKADFGDMSRMQLFNQLRSVGSIEYVENKEGTLHVRLNKVHLSFFHYPYKVLRPLIVWQGIKLAQLEDIAPMKLNAILGRGSKKDFIDLFFIAKKIGFKEIFELSLKKFPKQMAFHLHVVRALVYFKDANLEPMPRMLMDVDWRVVKKYFESEVKKDVKAILR